jgi:hypothetical protein
LHLADRQKAALRCLIRQRTDVPLSRIQRHLHTGATAATSRLLGAAAREATARSPVTPGGSMNLFMSQNENYDPAPAPLPIASVLESAKRLKIDLRAYLADILPRLATTKVSEVPTLTPAAWLAAQGTQ